MSSRCNIKKIKRRVMSQGCCFVQKRARLGIDANRDELLGDDTHDSEDQVCVTNLLAHVWVAVCSQVLWIDDYELVFWEF